MPYIQRNNHIQFILKPAITIIKEAIGVLNATKGGIETYPISGYLLHSLFLRLTGAQEQKLKCICWEMACQDYEYRYERYERTRYSECSNYQDKCMVYSDILNEIKKLDSTFAITDILKDEILVEWRMSMQQLFKNSLLVHSFQREYNDYTVLVANVQKDWIMNGSQLFVKKENISELYKRGTCGLGLYEIFTKYVYAERNRCAHNTKSYQHNLPLLKDILAPDFKLQNYFLYMSIIILLDKIYVKLFRIYLDKSK